MTEKEIQDHIWKNKSDWADFLLPVTFPPKINVDNPSHLKPAEVIFNMVIKEYEKIYDSIYGLDLIGCEVQLKKDSDSTIRADFLGILEGRNGLTVVELKKSRQTERQAFTELLAYGGHLKTVFSPMSKMDIAYVLISPMEERIVREATINSILYDKIHIITLIPTFENDDLNTLKFRPWLPTFNEIETLTTSVFSQNNFDIFKVTWDALEGDWSPEKSGDDPDKYMIEKMNAVSAYASQIMEAKGIHGFVYTMQNWSETKSTGHLINAIILAGINPYKATKNRVLTSKYNLSQKEADEVNVDYFSILEIIPELSKSLETDDFEINPLSWLSLTWDNEIAGIGFRVVKTLTKSIAHESIETSYGGFDWETYQQYTREDSHCHNFKIRLTGLIRELYFEYSNLDYDFIRKNGLEEHIQYWDKNIPKYLVDIANAQYYIRPFLKRLFDPYFEISEEENLDDSDIPS